MIHEEREKHLRDFYGDELIDKLHIVADGVEPELLYGESDEGRIYVDFGGIGKQLGIPLGLVNPVRFAYWKETGILVDDVPWGSLKAGWKTSKYEKEYSAYLTKFQEMWALELTFAHQYNVIFNRYANDKFESLAKAQPVKEEPRLYFIHSVQRS